MLLETAGKWGDDDYINCVLPSMYRVHVGVYAVDDEPDDQTLFEERVKESVSRSRPAMQLPIYAWFVSSFGKVLLYPYAKCSYKFILVHYPFCVPML